MLEPMDSWHAACAPAALANVAGNLLRNALKFLPDAHRQERWVRIRASEKSGDVHIEIEDNGPGLPHGHERLFEPFVRGQSASPKAGLGLGLATVKRIVSAYGGRVGARPGGDGGSCFWFDLPRAPAAALIDAPPAPATPTVMPTA
jgi:signal transduction histidine kinase